MHILGTINIFVKKVEYAYKLYFNVQVQEKKRDGICFPVFWSPEKLEYSLVLKYVSLKTTWF